METTETTTLEVAIIIEKNQIIATLTVTQESEAIIPTTQQINLKKNT